MGGWFRDSTADIASADPAGAAGPLLPPADGRALSRRGFCGGLALSMLPGLVHAQNGGRVSFISPQGYRPAMAEILVAMAGGHFKAQTIDVQFIPGASSPQAVQQVIAGQALAGRTAGITHLSAVAKGAAIKAIGTIAHGSPFYMLSSAQHPVQSPADLAGATVGLISQNGPSENTLDAMLLDANLPKTAVQRQYVGDNPGAYALLEAGRLRAFVGAIDTFLRAKASHPDLVAFNTGRYMPLPGQIYLATEAAIDKQADVLKAFLRGVKAAVAAIVADTDKKETLKLIRTFPIEGAADDALTIDILNANQDLWLSAGTDNILRNVPENWAKGVDLAVQAGFGEKVDPQKLYTNALLG